MSEKPIMHGRDHRPGGMDPIPNLYPAGVAARVHVTDFTQSIDGGEVAYGAVDYDTNGMADLGTNPTRLTATVAGYYIFTSKLQTSFVSGDHGQWLINLQVNGSFVQESEMTFAYYCGITTDASAVQTAYTAPLNVGDYVETETDLSVYAGSSATSITFGSFSALLVAPLS